MQQKIKGTAVILKEGEDVNRALRRFKNKVEDFKDSSKERIL
jgi:ribosomal protein S21